MSLIGCPLSIKCPMHLASRNWIEHTDIYQEGISVGFAYNTVRKYALYMTFLSLMLFPGVQNKGANVLC